MDKLTREQVNELTCYLIDKKINQLIANKAYNLFTYQLVYSLTKTVLLLLCLRILCYSVFNYFVLTMNEPKLKDFFLWL